VTEPELCHRLRVSRTQTMNKYVPMENATVSKLWNIASTYNTDDDEEMALAAFRMQVQKYRDDVKALRYDGSNCSMMGEEGGPDYKWSFPGSLLFSITVVTTIGISLSALWPPISRLSQNFLVLTSVDALMRENMGIQIDMHVLQQVCQSSVLSDRNVCWPRRMLPSLVNMTTGKTDRRTQERTQDRYITAMRPP